MPKNSDKTETKTVVSSELYTAEAKESAQQAQSEVSTPDPEPEVAEAAIEENTVCKPKKPLAMAMMTGSGLVTK